MARASLSVSRACAVSVGDRQSGDESLNGAAVTAVGGERYELGNGSSLEQPRSGSDRVLQSLQQAPLGGTPKCPGSLACESRRRTERE